MDTHLGSAVVAEDLSGRRLLQHLGLARRISDRADRVFMVPEEQVHWRELLPVVLRNKGYGWLFVRPPGPDAESEKTPGIDSLEVMGKRYEVERIEDYILVGQDRADEGYRHVFTVGEEYLVSIAEYGEARLEEAGALRALGLSRADSAGTGKP